jgi:hypothetical protein
MVVHNNKKYHSMNLKCLIKLINMDLPLEYTTINPGRIIVRTKIHKVNNPAQDSKSLL